MVMRDVETSMITRSHAMRSAYIAITGRRATFKHPQITYAATML